MCRAIRGHSKVKDEEPHIVPVHAAGVTTAGLPWQETREDAPKMPVLCAHGLPDSFPLT